MVVAAGNTWAAEEGLPGEDSTAAGAGRMAGRTAGEEGLADSNRWRDPGLAAGRMEAGSNARTASRSVPRLLSGIKQPALRDSSYVFNSSIDSSPPPVPCAKIRLARRQSRAAGSDKAAREGLTYLSAMVKTQNSSLLFLLCQFSCSLVCVCVGSGGVCSFYKRASGVRG